MNKDERIKELEEANERYIKEKDKRLGKVLNDKIKELLLYVGFASAIISIFGYIAITVVMIKGFESAFELQNQILFSLVGAGVGLVITFALRYQGIAFAKAEEESKGIMKLYYEAMNKNKKEKELKDINYYMIKATIIDVVIKGIIFIVITTLVIDLFSKGNGDWSLIWLMLFNILMFTGFGLMAIAKAYDHYIEQHIPVIVERTKKLNERDKDSEQLFKEYLDNGKPVSIYTLKELEEQNIPFTDLPKDYSEGEIE